MPSEMLMHSPSSSSAPTGPYLHKLPSELIDRIISHLVQNQNRTDVITAKKTLAACSLASWIFVPPCRHAMFAFNSTVEPAFTGIGYDEVEELIELMDSPVQTIGMGLRRIRFMLGVGLSRRKSRRGESAVGRAGEGRILEITQRVIETLGNVVSIYLDGVPPAHGSSGVESAFWKLIGVLRGVKELKVEAGGLVGNAKILEWVCELPELEYISVVNPTAGLRQEKPGLRGEDMLQFKLKRADKTRVTLVEIGGPEELNILRWLLAQSPVPRVKSVRMRGPLGGCWDDGRYEDGPKLVKQFFQVCGSGVGHLSVVVPKGEDFGETLEAMDLDRCDSLHSIHIEGIRVGPESAAGKEQRRALEMLLEKMFIKSLIGPGVNRVALTVQVDPPSREAFAFFGISDVGLFKDFEWGRVPEILERVWLDPCSRDSRRQSHAPAAVSGGDKWSYRGALAHRSQDVAADARKELVIIIQGGSKHGRARLVDVLREGVFRVFDESGSFSVHFDAEGAQPRGYYL